jgi:hypothetical protein
MLEFWLFRQGMASSLLQGRLEQQQCLLDPLGKLLEGTAQTYYR